MKAKAKELPKCKTPKRCKELDNACEICLAGFVKWKLKQPKD